MRAWYRAVVVCLVVGGISCKETPGHTTTAQPAVTSEKTSAQGANVAVPPIQNSTEYQAEIDAVNGLLSGGTADTQKDENEKPDLSPSAIGSRSVLPGSTAESSECQSPIGEVGVCGTVRQCPGIFRFRDPSYLRRFLCGYQRQTPLICCPLQWTTSYYNGYRQPVTTTRRPSYNNYGGYDYYNQRPNYEGGGRPYQPEYNRYPPNPYDIPQPPPYDSYSQYGQRPDHHLHFRSTTTTTSKPVTTTTTTVKAQPAAESTDESVVRPRKPSSLPSVCGTGLGLSRIVGGSVVTPGSYPWMAAIYIQSGSSWLQACGGALVSQKHVVTAAHCVVAGSRSQNLPTKLFLIRLGDHNLETTDDLPQGVTIDVKVSKISRHSNFDSKTYKNDISIMELETPVTFSKFIQPLCLPYDGVYNKLDDEIAIVTGWGYTKYQGKGSDVLKQAAIRIWPRSECKEAFKKEVDITPEYICAGDGSGKQDSCQGDSGGPLVYNEGTKFYLIGIVSFGKKCATPGYPGAYTNVVRYLDWINSHL